jgi:phage terminase large subunit GpA-like protein
MTRIDELVRETLLGFKPPAKLSLSEWADLKAVLSAESSAESGRWHTLPYQKGIMDAFTDPAIEQITVMKSARVGYTKILNHAIGYHIDQDPCSMMMVQPTIEDAEGYSKEEIAPMIRDTPCLQGLVSDVKAKDGTNTLLSKAYPGGTLGMVGANSGRGFRRVSRRVILLDEVDGYPASAGTEGDPIRLAIKRSEYFWNRKIVAGSTPLLKETSRILKLFLQSDQRRRFLPCPHCGHMQFLKFRPSEDDKPFAGMVAYMKWDEVGPATAHFICAGRGCRIEHRSKRHMDERGEWVPLGPRGKHAGFHIWAGYSYSPNSTWADLVQEFLDSKSDPLLLQTFINTALGECWEEDYAARVGAGELQARAEDYEPGVVPEGAVLLTAGVDVQDNRFEIKIDAWGEGEQSWVVGYETIFGDPAQPEIWKQLDEALFRAIPHANGAPMKLSAIGIDTGGHFTHEVYQYARDRRHRGVIALKGSSQRNKPAISKPSKQDVNIKGRPLIKGGVDLYTVGTDTVKTLLYGRFKIQKPGPGYVHFHQALTTEFFEQLTVEKKVYRYLRGQPVPEWTKPNAARNEALDCSVYSYAALQWLMTKFHRKTIFEQFAKKLEAAKPVLVEKKNEQGAPLQKTEVARKLNPMRKKGFISSW